MRSIVIKIIMNLLKKYDKQNKKDLIKLIKESRKKEEEINKEFQNRINTKYTTQALKENKKMFTQNAMTIDKLEYEKMVMDLKNRLEK